jgi:microcystin-dependent protein
MGAQFTIPLVTVIPGQLIASNLWNNEFNNLNTNLIPAGIDSYSDTDGQMQIQTAPYPGSVTSHAANLGGEIERIRYQISAILGTTYWYNAPAASIATAVNSLVPVGGVIDYPSATPPNATYWHLANGTAIDRTIYATLFSLIGTTFGVGDGVTSFNLPNYTDRLSIAAGNLYALAATGGAVSNTPTISVTDSGHNHTQNSHTHVLTGHTHSTPSSNLNTTGGLVPHGTTPIVTTTGTNMLIGESGAVNATALTATIPASTTGTGVDSIASSTSTNNSNTTGITAGSTSVPTLPPYLGMYKMIRVL